MVRKKKTNMTLDNNNSRITLNKDTYSTLTTNVPNKEYIDEEKDKVIDYINEKNNKIVNMVDRKFKRHFEKEDKRFDKVNAKIDELNSNMINKLSNVHFELDTATNTQVEIISNIANLEMKIKLLTISVGIEFVSIVSFLGYIIYLNQ